MTSPETARPPDVGRSGAAFAALAAVLFGASTPFAKLLLGHLSPLLLAGLLYLGSGLGLAGLVLVRRAMGHVPSEAPLSRADGPWLTGAILSGGILGPLLLMVGLRATPASSASLLLNLEGVLTAALAWFAFHEHFSGRIALGMLLIVAGGAVLSWQGSGSLAMPWGSLSIVGACLCWGLDNNLTQKVSAADPVQVAALKGGAAGTVNLLLGLVLGSPMPRAQAVGGALLLGAVGYGLSLVLFVLALRSLGTARTGAYFSVAPFAGSAIALVMLREPASPHLLAAALLMGAGVGLHLTERHHHRHSHEPQSHSHGHTHGDSHHQHLHLQGAGASEPHSHEHAHEPTCHDHSHFPDYHHRHQHP